MNTRRLAYFVSSIAMLSVLAPATAFAQEEAPPAAAPPPAAPPPAAAEEAPDGVRFRGAVAAEGGALILPDIVTLGLAGVQAELGVQINHLIGVYAVPQFDVVFGQVGGINVGAALLVDFTIIDEISVGLGPEVAAFAAIGGSVNGVAAAGGELYGGRIHAGFQPAWGRGEDGIRRKAFHIGLDLRLLAGAAGVGSSNGTTASAAATQFVAAPMLSIGYQAF